MVARALWRSEALRVVPWLRPCTRLRLAYGSCKVSDQGTTLRASDLHNARATILNHFNNVALLLPVLKWSETARLFIAAMSFDPWNYLSNFDGAELHLKHVSKRDHGPQLVHCPMQIW